MLLALLPLSTICCLDRAAKCISHAGITGSACSACFGCPPPDDVVLLQEGTAFFPGSSLAGNGLLVSDGELWKRQRQLSNPAFRRAAVDSYTDVRCMFISSHAKMASGSHCQRHRHGACHHAQGHSQLELTLCQHCAQGRPSAATLHQECCQQWHILGPLSLAGQALNCFHPGLLLPRMCLAVPTDLHALWCGAADGRHTLVPSLQLRPQLQFLRQAALLLLA